MIILLLIMMQVSEGYEIIFNGKSVGTLDKEVVYDYPNKQIHIDSIIFKSGFENE